MSIVLKDTAQALPVALAAEFARQRSLDLPPSERKSLGQYFTPVGIARFMASLCTIAQPEITILDPGAGTGILAAALCTELASREPSLLHKVQLIAYEIDHELFDALDSVCREIAKFLLRKGIKFSYKLCQSDFILDNAEDQDTHFNQRYDVIIVNPPYFKISMNDPRARLLADICYGQPNIYGLFLALSARLLSGSGQLISITPRSFASGDYFKRIRKELLNRALPDRVHLFESRNKAFRGDSVLQENVIVRFVARTSESNNCQVAITTSHGIEDLDRHKAILARLSDLIDLSSDALRIMLPASEQQQRLIKGMLGHDLTLQSLGCKINTGRIVAFRCRQFLKDNPSGKSQHVPMLWLQNVKPMEIIWPTKNGSKPQYMMRLNESHKLLLKQGNYVLVRRFSAKEDKTRIVAAPLTADSFHADYIGVENHLNVIVLPEDKATPAACMELAEYLNSSEVETYFRITNGNTQINASELRDLPIPKLKSLS